MNEKPKTTSKTAAVPVAVSGRLGHFAVVHTSMGDITIQLFFNEFVLSLSNYYFNNNSFLFLFTVLDVQGLWKTSLFIAKKDITMG